MEGVELLQAREVLGEPFKLVTALTGEGEQDPGAGGRQLCQNEAKGSIEIGARLVSNR